MADTEHVVCRGVDLLEGGMRAVEVAGRKVLLARVAGRCHAVGATCPHAGGPLAEGVLRGGVVTCPWHKAAFDVETGRRREPPALDDLPRIPVREAGGQVLVSPVDAPGRVDPMSDRGGGASPDGRCMVILGSGAAGATAAQTLREEGFSGRVVMVSREDRLPYDRTVLSKYALSGQEGGEKTPLQDAAFYERHLIERLCGEVRSLDPSARAVLLADGTRLGYDAALLATGAEPRPLEVPGGGLPGVFLLRGPTDAEAIAAAAEAARRAVVVGANFIAMEAAASLRERGLDVTVAAPQPVPFERQLGPEIGGVFRRLHEGRGVAFRLGRKVVSVEGEGRVRAVALDDGSILPADLVVAGLGVVPATSVLQGVQRREDGGVAADATLRLAEGLYAAGDIASFPLHGDGPPVRVEHWRVAEQHGRVAALNMLGRGVAYDAVPFFWTIQYRQRLDYAGHAKKWDELAVDGDLEKPDFLAFFVRQGRAAAVAGWNRDRQMAAAIGLMAERRDWPVPALRDALRQAGLRDVGPPTRVRDTQAKEFALAHWLPNGADGGDQSLFGRCFGGDGTVRENAASDVLASLTTMVWNAPSKSWTGGATMADASLNRRMTVRLGDAVAFAQIGIVGLDGQIELGVARL